MVTKWGMSDKVGPVEYAQPEGESFLGYSSSQPVRMSNATAQLIDYEIKGIVENASQAVNVQMLSDYTDDDPAAFKRLVAGGSQAKVFPPDVLKAFYDGWTKVNDNLRSTNANYKKISDSMTAFMDQVRGFDKINSYAFLNFVYSNT